MCKIFICIFLFVASFLPAQKSLSLDIGDWEPFTSSRDPDSRILELLVKEIFALSDLEVEYNYYPWLRSLKNVEKGYSDGSFPLIKTPEKQKTTISSQEPILVEETVFFHLKSLQFTWCNF